MFAVAACWCLSGQTKTIRLQYHRIVITWRKWKQASIYPRNNTKIHYMIYRITNYVQTIQIMHWQPVYLALLSLLLLKKGLRTFKV